SCASELHTALGMSQPRVARHLKILVDAGLVLARRDGRFVRYVLTRETAEGRVVQAARALLPANTSPAGKSEAPGEGPRRRTPPAEIPPAVRRSVEATDAAEEPPRDVMEDFLL
ncbi:MAG: hypothetical protein FD129_1201, partial [bacterium]